MVQVFKEDKEIPPIKIGANVKERASLVAQTVKNLPVMWETWVQSLGWEDPLEEGMTTHSIFLPGESPGTEDPGRLQFTGSQRVNTTQWHTHTHTHTPGKGKEIWFSNTDFATYYLCVFWASVLNSLSFNSFISKMIEME